MIGRKLTVDETKRTLARKSGETVLEVKALTSIGRFYDISFALAKGEILGLAGLVGSGRTEVVPRSSASIRSTKARCCSTANPTSHR